jgi:hypothetical protein
MGNFSGNEMLRLFGSAEKLNSSRKSEEHFPMNAKRFPEETTI